MVTELMLKAKEALVDDNFELAIELYGQALANPDHAQVLADLYADRAQANIKLESYTEAVADANRAIELDPSMTKAYLRKGTACIKLEEYQNAKTALETGASLAPGDSRFTKFIKECEKRISEETVNLPKVMAAPHLTNWAIELPKELKFRYKYRDTPTEVVLTIIPEDENVPLEKIVISFCEENLSIGMVDAAGDGYYFYTRLFAKIDMGKSTHKVFPRKVEIRIVKAESSPWESLLYNESGSSENIFTLTAIKFDMNWVSDGSDASIEELESNDMIEEVGSKMDVETSAAEGMEVKEKGRAKRKRVVKSE